MNQIEPDGLYALALHEIVEWGKDNGWTEAYEPFQDEYFQGIQELIEVPYQEVMPALPEAIQVLAMRACFDQFLTSTFESEPSNPIDHYLESVGSQLDEATVAFLIAFRYSAMSLYEVIEREPGSHIILRDLYREPSSITVDDQPFALLWKKGDTVATRVVNVDGRAMLGGTSFIAHELWRGNIVEAMHEMLAEGEQWTLQGDLGGFTHSGIAWFSGMVIPCTWIATSLAILGEWDRPPYREETDDQDLVYVEAMFPLLQSSQSVFDKLESFADLVRPPLDALLWFWYRDKSDKEEPLKATVWMFHPRLLVSGYNREDVLEAVDALAKLLGDAVAEPEIEETPVEYEDEPSLPVQHANEDDTTYRDRVHAYLDVLYQGILDDQVTELGDKVPRNLAKTSRGRKQLASWLHSLERQLRETADQIGFADYDLNWIWKELEIEHLRQSRLLD